MTDSSGLLRDWRVVLAACVAVLSAAVATLVVRTGDPATADSYLDHVRDAALVLPDGTLAIARDGLRVPEGAVVRTGATGGATLTTAGRDVYLGGLTTVRVVDGVHQSLERGQVVVDSRDGARLDLTTRAGTASLPDGALVRVETGPVLRLGVLSGKATLAASGRQVTAEVPALYQVQAPYTGLPGRPTPLALTDDAWEQQLAPELVNADRDLNALARGLAGTDGVTVLQAAPVALREVRPTSTDRGEQALGVAVAQASRRGSQLKDTLLFVQAAREDGGSWGVVAALVDSRVSAVSALLDTVLAPPAPTPGTVVAVPTPALGGDGPGGPSPSTSGSSSQPTVGPSSSGPRPTKTASPRPTTTTSPSPDLITTVMNLLSPSPRARPEGSPSPTGLLHLPLGG